MESLELLEGVTRGCLAEASDGGENTGRAEEPCARGMSTRPPCTSVDAVKQNQCNKHVYLVLILSSLLYAQNVIKLVKGLRDHPPRPPNPFGAAVSCCSAVSPLHMGRPLPRYVVVGRFSVTFRGPLHRYALVARCFAPFY